MREDRRSRSSLALCKSPVVTKNWSPPALAALISWSSMMPTLTNDLAWSGQARCHRVRRSRLTEKPVRGAVTVAGTLVSDLVPRNLGWLQVRGRTRRTEQRLVCVMFFSPSCRSCPAGRNSYHRATIAPRVS
jgi:hypothetical protein